MSQLDSSQTWLLDSGSNFNINQKQRTWMLTTTEALPARRAQAPPDFVVKLFQMLQNEDDALISWDSGSFFFVEPTM